MSALITRTDGYTRAESWFYDTFIAGSLARASAELTDIVGPECANGPVLDVGCGGGQQLVALARRYPGAELVGIDHSAAQVGRAAERVAGFGERVQVHQGSAEHLEFGDNTFAASVSYGSIKHWRDQASGLAEMVRVLKPGGLLFVLELDRGATLDDTWRFFERLTRLRYLGPLGLMGFRTFVVGRSIDLEDARTLVGGLPLTDVVVERRPDEPILQVGGRKVIGD